MSALVVSSAPWLSFALANRADCRARAEMGWEAKRDLIEMCTDAWRWQSDNPRGYGA